MLGLARLHLRFLLVVGGVALAGRGHQHLLLLFNDHFHVVRRLLERFFVGAARLHRLGPRSVEFLHQLLQNVHVVADRLDQFHLLRFEPLEMALLLRLHFLVQLEQGLVGVGF